MKKYILIGIGIVIFIGYILGFILPFASQFTSHLTSDYEAWSAFGSYYGGVLSPLFTFLSFVVVLFIFREEMKLKRSELEESKVDLEKERMKQELKDEEQNIINYLNWIESRINNFKNTVKRNRNLETNYSSAELVYFKIERLIELMTALKEIFNTPDTELKVQKLSKLFYRYYDMLSSFCGIADLYFRTYDSIIKSNYKDKYLPIYKAFLSMNIAQLICFAKTLSIDRNEEYKDFIFKEFGEEVMKAFQYGEEIVRMGTEYMNLSDKYHSTNTFDFLYIKKMMAD